MAKIRYQPILHSNEKPVTLDTANVPIQLAINNILFKNEA